MELDILRTRDGFRAGSATLAVASGSQQIEIRETSADTTAENVPSTSTAAVSKAPQTDGNEKRGRDNPVL